MIDRRRRRLFVGSALIDLAILIALLVTFVGEPPFDLRIVRDAAAWRDGAVGQVMDAASDYGYGMWLVPVSLLVSLALAWYPHHRRDAAIVALSTTFAVIVTRVLKELFERTRPPGAHELVAGFSMPSGHATSAAAFATSLVLAAHGTRWAWTVGVALGAFALLVGVSRVVLGVHYPTDVVAGFCSGAGVALVISAIVDYAGVGRRGGPTGDAA